MANWFGIVGETDILGLTNLPFFTYCPVRDTGVIEHMLFYYLFLYKFFLCKYECLAHH